MELSSLFLRLLDSGAAPRRTTAKESPTSMVFSLGRSLASLVVPGAAGLSKNAAIPLSVQEIKAYTLDIFEFVFDVRLDFRVTQRVKSNSVPLTRKSL